MKREKKHLIIKIGAYVILVLGFLIALAILLAAVITLVSMPDASIQRKITASLLMLICSFIISLITLSIFESMIDLIVVEDKLFELEDHQI